jgi:outer membrane protein assembly factor BamD
MLKKGFGFLLFLLVTGSMLLSSCSEYNKLLKSTDYDKKYEMAMKYYEEENYFKAYPLLEELATLYRGTDKAEKIYFYYAYCNYHMEDFDLAAFHFKNFVKNYPTSVHAEEALYMNAYTYYLTSPEPSLDQSNTVKAISELQLFINKYPSSQKAIEATSFIDKLRHKLETKAFNNCMQYYRTQNYKAAIVAAENAIKEFPTSQYNEELLFITLKSSYLYALNSIEAKKQTRLKETIEHYKNFIEQYPESSHRKEADVIRENTNKAFNKPS